MNEDKYVKQTQDIYPNYDGEYRSYYNHKNKVPGPIYHEMSEEEEDGNYVPEKNTYERAKWNSRGYNQSGT